MDAAGKTEIKDCASAATTILFSADSPLFAFALKTEVTQDILAKWALENPTSYIKTKSGLYSEQ